MTGSGHLRRSGDEGEDMEEQGGQVDLGTTSHTQEKIEYLEPVLGLREEGEEGLHCRHLWRQVLQKRKQETTSTSVSEFVWRW